MTQQIGEGAFGEGLRRVFLMKVVQEVYVEETKYSPVGLYLHFRSLVECIALSTSTALSPPHSRQPGPSSQVQLFFLRLDAKGSLR